LVSCPPPGGDRYLKPWIIPLLKVSKGKVPYSSRWSIMECDDKWKTCHVTQKWILLWR